MNWLSETGAPKNLKLMECPGCSKCSCYWIGGGPKDIECLNKICKYFKLPPDCKKPNTLTTLFPYYVPPGPMPEVTLEDLSNKKPKENWGDE